MLERIVTNLENYLGVNISGRLEQARQAIQVNVTTPAYNLYQDYYQYYFGQAQRQNPARAPQPARPQPPSAGDAATNTGDAGLSRDRGAPAAATRPTGTRSRQAPMQNQDAATIARLVNESEQRFLANPNAENTSEYISVLEMARSDLDHMLSSTLVNFNAVKQQLDAANAERVSLRAQLQELQETKDAIKEERDALRAQQDQAHEEELDLDEESAHKAAHTAISSRRRKR